MDRQARKKTRLEGELRSFELYDQIEEEELDYGDDDSVSEEQNIREEGEAASEEEDDDSSSLHRHHRQNHLYKSSSSSRGCHKTDREEGEASSDEELQGMKQQGLGNSSQETLEREYRHRITERQAMRRQRNEAEGKKYSPARPPPRSKFDSPSPQKNPAPNSQPLVSKCPTGIHKSASLGGLEDRNNVSRKSSEKIEEVDDKKSRRLKEGRSPKTRNPKHHDKPIKTSSASLLLAPSSSQPDLRQYASLALPVESTEYKKPAPLPPKESSRRRTKVDYTSTSPSPPVTARNRSRSPPQDRRSTKSSKSCSAHRSSQMKRDRQNLQLEQQQEVGKEDDEVAAVKKIKHEKEETNVAMKTPLIPTVAVMSPAFLLEPRAGRAPIIDGSRFKYDEGFASSSSSEDEEDTRQQEEVIEDREGESLMLEGVNGDGIEEIEDDKCRRLQEMEPAKPFYYPSIQGCRSVDEFECLNRIEEGTYGVVYRARDKKTMEVVALKRLKMEKERDGFPITSLREINTLMKAQHENIVTVREIVVGFDLDKIYLVMEFVEHDLKALMEVMSGPFSVGEVKCLLVQLLRAVSHMHDNWILHRDLKTSNLLLSHKGILKVGDFGLAREYGSPLQHYTEIVVTLWYRAPELLLGAKSYSCPIDLWSVGCIFAEFLLQRPLFPGKGEVDELNIIFRDLGTPNERIWPGCTQLPGMKKCVFTEYAYNNLRRRFTEKQISDHGFDLLNSFLTYCPERRITAEKALSHSYFNERPREIHPSMFPSWPAKSEGGYAANKRFSPRAPHGGGAAQLRSGAASSSLTTFSGLLAGGKEPPPPLGGQRFYAARSPNSRSNTGQLVGTRSGMAGSGGPDEGFLLKF